MDQSYVFKSGKHAGKSIRKVPLRYLESLLALDDLQPFMREMVQAEYQRRSTGVRRRYQAMVDEDEKVTGEGFKPVTIGTFHLNVFEAEMIWKACDKRELVIGPDVPCDSPLEGAWREWCRIMGWECRMVQKTWQDVEREMEDSP